MKYDIRKLTLAADTLLPRLTDPRHRAIVQNYRKHAMLEVSGRYHEIFEPDMTVEKPFYRIATAEKLLELDGIAAVKVFYSGLLESGATVMMLEHELLSVADWGFSSEALYNSFIPGRTAMAKGLDVDDPDAIYIESRWVCMSWPYDERCRMIGEHVYPAPTATIRKCPAEEILTLEEVRDVFAPLIATARIEVPQLQPA